MKTDKGQFDTVPAAVPRAEFKRILGNLVKSGPVKRSEERTGEKKKGATIIPPKPPLGLDQK
jgi:hypothetical protein